MPTANIGQNTADTLRKRLRQARAQLPGHDRDRGALLMRGRLFSWLAVRSEKTRAMGLPPPTIAAFWPLEDEPDLRPLMRQWVQQGVRVALPVVQEKSAPLAFPALDETTPMEPGAYGIPEPQGTATVIPTVILVPALGYTQQADRIGYGGGYYDRTLYALRAAGHRPATVGVAWACGLALPDEYLPAMHDEKLDAIVTDKGWVPTEPA